MGQSTAPRPIERITFCGGGALRLLGVVDEILRLGALAPHPQLVFMDTDVARAETMAALATKMPSARENMPVTAATDDLDVAIEGADFVYCCLRVGGVAALERDERIGASYGFHGHDDFGPSGAMLTARTVPVVLKIARAMEKRCPDATLLIFTNPITNMVDAVTRCTSIRSIGICSGVYNFVWDVDALFDTGVPVPDLDYLGGGINHLSWVTEEATCGQHRVMDMIWRDWDHLPNRKNAERCGWSWLKDIVRIDRVMPLNNGHQGHFLLHDRMAKQLKEGYEHTDTSDLRSTQQDLAAEEAAALAHEPVIENFWQREVFRKCKAKVLGDLGVQTMASIAGDRGDVLHINVPNHGHIRDLPEGAVVEAPVRVHRDRLKGLDLDPIPMHYKGLCRAVAHHQRMLVDASVEGNRESLMRALAAEPTIGSLDRVRPMFDELWTAAVEHGEI